MATIASEKIWADLRELLLQGPSLMVATRDERLSLELSRVAGARLGDDGLLRMALPLPESRRAIWNLEDNSVVALSVVLPTTYRNLQLKGRDVRAIEWPGHEAIARAHGAAFREQVIAVGVPIELSSSFLSLNRFATFAFTPSEVYEQTPGPGAGLRVHT
ncbi:MAG: hypothetical protein WDO69_34880 [Pseudomonadota bacterium]